MLQEIQRCGDLETVCGLGPQATVVDLHTITKVRLNLLTNLLMLEYRPDSCQSAVRVNIECATDEIVDEIYSKLWRRLGDRFEVRANVRDPWDLARGPVVVIAVILLLTPILALVSNAALDGSPEQIANMPAVWRLFARIDWRVICGVGGSVLALLQIWLYRRLTRPPTRLELVPKCAEASSFTRPVSESGLRPALACSLRE